MDQTVLMQLGLNVSASAIYDFLRGLFQKHPQPTQDFVRKALASFLNIQNAEVVADRVIEFLAKNGDIRIEGTRIYANESVSFFSSQNTKFTFGNSVSETKNTKIVTGQGARIEGQGGAGIKQNEDGSISFFA